MLTCFIYNTCGFNVSTIAMMLSICSFSFTTCRYWCISSGIHNIMTQVSHWWHTYHAVLIWLWLEVVLCSLNEHYDVGEGTNRVLHSNKHFHNKWHNTCEFTPAHIKKKICAIKFTKAVNKIAPQIHTKAVKISLKFTQIILAMAAVINNN